MSKQLVQIHTQRMGLCRLEDGTVALYAETKDAIYYLPMEKAQNPQVVQLKTYLWLKYGETTSEGFLACMEEVGWDPGLYFDEGDGILLREKVIDDVDAYLKTLETNRIAAQRAQLRRHLILKYGGDVTKAFLDHGLDEPLENYFNEDGRLILQRAAADVDTWLECQAAGS